MFRFGLALGGGAAKGFAHLGVLKVLEENGLIPDLIVGTSMGAVVGAVYSWKGNIKETRDHFKRFLESEYYDRKTYQKFKEIDQKEPEGIWVALKHLITKGMIYGKTLTARSVMSAEDYEEDLEILVPIIDFNQLKIPFGCIASDLISGEEVLITSGNLRKAVMASAAIPGVYSPVVTEERFLVDGGSTNKLPINPTFQLGADVVVGVDVSRQLEPVAELHSAMDIILRSNTVSTYHLDRIQSLNADFLLYPNVEDLHWADFSQLETAMERGIEVARKNIHRIRRVLLKKRVKKSLWLCKKQPIYHPARIIGIT
jgi:NTE family protein